MIWLSVKLYIFWKLYIYSLLIDIFADDLDLPLDPTFIN